MKITLLVVGKTTDAHIEVLIQEYQKRLTHYVPFVLQVIPELKNTKALTMEQQKQAEGDLILRAVSSNADLVLLDEHGKEFRSVEFAEYLQKRMSSGTLRRGQRHPPRLRADRRGNPRTVRGYRQGD